MRSATLDELCEINVGRTPARAEPAFWGSGHRWLSIADMNQGLSIRDTKEQITAAGARAGKVVQPGTVLLSFKLSIGKVAIADVPLYTNEAIAALPIKDDALLDARYLMRALQAMDLASGSNRAAMGATLNKRSLAQIQLPLVSLPEQRRIAAILDQADDIRAKRRQVLAHLDSLTQSIFHNMFGDSTFPTVPASRLMPSMRNGVSPASRGSCVAEVLTLSAITRGSFDSEAKKSGRFVGDPPSDKRVSAADFLMCRGNGNRALVGVGVRSASDRPDLVFPDTVIAGRIDTSVVVPGFLEAAWRQRVVRDQIESLARTTSGIHKVNQQTLSQVQVSLPPFALQKEFSAQAVQIQIQRAVVRSAGIVDDALFASLQARAFRGEL